ncbi:hypothetical protein [Peribacillus frigoritolerans]|uniref:hypothetical protein n=1 Tax=Peribacillus frigoritolerans TaxID=450367 RepID=UPI0020BECDEC|nr:hypothetical protein [Peribacillus frigoritolerans]
MGYIAPVTQFDYIQYANRTVEAAGKVRIVKGAAPINPSVLIRCWKGKGKALKD